MTPEHEGPIVYVVDDDASVRAALEDLLSSVGFDARLFASAQAFMDASRPEVPSCLVLDVRMPGLGGLDFQQALTQAGAAYPIIFITGHGDVQMGVRAMKAGAVDFLTKPFRDQDLLDAINAALARDRIRLGERAKVDALRRKLLLLNPGEREVFALVVEGLLNKQIAARLDLSEITVKVRRGHVMRKMEAQSLPDLVRMAAILGVAPLAT